MATLSEYLRQRSLVIDPVAIEQEEDAVLADEALLKEAAELWESKKSLLTMAVQARINAILKYQVNKAIPEEVMVYRQAVIELGALLTDFEKYKGEHGRRAPKPDDNTAPQGEEAQPEPPPVEEGKEGSL